MKVLQTNLGRARAAHDLAMTVACEENIDLLIISEPNKNIASSSQYLADSRMDVAVLPINKSVGIHNHTVRNGYVILDMGGWRIFCCYCSPNISLEDYKAYTDTLMSEVTSGTGEVIIAGDLNTKSVLWGSPVTDSRGNYLMEWISSLDLVVVNRGLAPTFVRGNSKSYIDVTLASPKLGGAIEKWEVLEGEFMTYHQHIRFEIVSKKTPSASDRIPKPFFHKAKFVEVLADKLHAVPFTMTLAAFLEVIEQATNESLIYPPRNETKFPYWWNTEIGEQRKTCITLRRKIIRANANDSIDPTHRSSLNEQYKTAKNALKALIRKSKKLCWERLCRDLDDDIWGEGYKIVTKNFGKLNQPYNPPYEQRIAIIKSLFPERSDSWLRTPTITEGVPPFTTEELSDAVGSTRLGGAPGPDHIPPEAVRAVAEIAPRAVLSIMNHLLERQEFPAVWKEATVVLIRKKIPQNSPPAYRPICLLNSLGKLYEKLIKGRLESQIEENGGFNDRQFGFRKGRSAIHAVNTLADRVRNTKAKWVAMVALDIKNAFNSVSWGLIIAELRHRKISDYLVNTIDSYFCNRTIKISKKLSIAISAGVPQGSVLGPVLWNVLYDGVLDLPLTEGATSIAYADDLAVLVEAEDAPELVFRVNESLDRIKEWMEHKNLEIAPQKTEAILLKGSRKRESISFEVAGQKVRPQKYVKYLGITLDERLTFGEHVKRTVTKAEEKLSALTRIMPNIGGPGSSKKKALYGVIQSVLLYGAPVWSSALNTKRIASLIGGVQRRALLRIACAYRTVSYNALLTITGIPPITLLIQEREQLSRTKNGNDPIMKGRERLKTIKKWQELWDSNTTNAAWTKRLIPNLEPWVACRFRTLNFYLTQFLTGHGSFGSYTNRFKLTDNDTCIYCGAVDSVEHTFYECVKWIPLRGSLRDEIGVDLNVSNTISTMLSSQETWNRISHMISVILTSKIEDLRAPERQRNEQ